MNKFIALALLAGSALADDAAHAAAASYGAPSVSYGAPANEYAAPTYDAPAPSYPADTYGAPADTYAEPSYDDGVSYQAADSGDAFDLSKITELLPLFLAVFAAIIVAQLFAPLLGMLFGAKVNLLTSLAAPLGPAKISLVDAVLAPFNLQLCTTANPPVAAGRSFGARSSGDVNVIQLLDSAYKIYEGRKCVDSCDLSHN